ncbi:MAG: hypothetical protein LBR55_04675 [Bacteroidales bacterium]|jgi:hypothetical protein|nr:hypothetical protein [Bacteroidales bacterium]
MKKLTTIILCITALTQVYAQNREGLNYGLRVGALFASNKTAEYYNGGINSLNTINYIFSIPEYYEQISEYFQSDFSLYNPSSPAVMRYKPSLQIGGTLQYFFNEKFAFITTVNLAKVRSEGVFQIQLASPSQSSQMGDNLQKGVITSTENRFGLELGAHYCKVLENSPVSPFVEGGALVAALTANNNALEIGNFNYTLYHKSDANNDTNKNHFGYGAFASVGAKLPIETKVILMLSFDMRAVKFSSLPPDAFTLQNSMTFSVLF